MMNKTKKFLAVLTLLCLMCGLTAVPVQAADYYKLTLDEDMSENLTTELFPEESMTLYPGESVESAIRIENDTNNRQTVNMEITKGDDNRNNLANFIWLTVTRDGVAAPIVDDVRLIEFDTAEVNNIAFPVDSTGIYRFTAVFRPTGVTNDQMSGTANFQVVFSVNNIIVNPTYPEEVPTTVPPVPDVPDAPPAVVADDGTPNEIIIPPAGPAAAQYTPPAAIASEDVPQETGAAPATPPEEADIGGDNVPLASANPDEPEPEATSEPQEYEDIPDGSVPLAEQQFVDKMPQTGETTDPAMYLTIGLTFVLAGGAVIITVNKKAKAK